MKKQSSCNDCHGGHSCQAMNMNMEINPFPISATLQEIQERESLIKQFGSNWSTFIFDSNESASTFDVADRKHSFSTLDCSSHADIVPMDVEDGSESREEASISRNEFDAVLTSYYDASPNGSVVSLDNDFPVERDENAEDVLAQRGGHREITVQRC